MNKFSNDKESAKKLARVLIWDLLDKWIDNYKCDTWISTIFLSGAPWAGKTEFLEDDIIHDSFIVIDIDKYRCYFKWYNGRNSSNFQDSCSTVATQIYNFCMRKNLKVIFDGTLTNDMWIQNISKAYKRNRKISIVLVYQDPIISFAATMLRNVDWSRQVSIKTFMRIYYDSIKYTFRALKKYKGIGFIIASKTKDGKYHQRTSVTNKDKFDTIYKITYNQDNLLEILNKIYSKDESFWKKILFFK